MASKRPKSSAATNDDAAAADVSSEATIGRLLHSGANERLAVMRGADPSDWDILFRFFESHKMRLGVAADMLMAQELAAMMHLLNPGAPDDIDLPVTRDSRTIITVLAPSPAAKCIYKACPEQTYVRLGCLFITVIGSSGSSKKQVGRHCAHPLLARRAHPSRPRRRAGSC